MADHSDDMEGCGDPTCFACHFKKALAAYYDATPGNDDLTKEQGQEILHVLAGTAGIILSGEPESDLQAFVAAVIAAKREDEKEVALRQILRGAGGAFIVIDRKH